MCGGRGCNEISQERPPVLRPRRYNRLAVPRRRRGARRRLPSRSRTRARGRSTRPGSCPPGTGGWSAPLAVPGRPARRPVPGWSPLRLPERPHYRRRPVAVCKVRAWPPDRPRKWGISRISTWFRPSGCRPAPRLNRWKQRRNAGLQATPRSHPPVRESRSGADTRRVILR